MATESQNNKIKGSSSRILKDICPLLFSLFFNDITITLLCELMIHNWLNVFDIFNSFFLQNGKWAFINRLIFNKNKNLEKLMRKILRSRVKSSEDSLYT